MKTITATQRQALEDLSAQGLLGGLPVQIAEKDIHVTDLLDELSRLEVRHKHFKALKRGELSKVDEGIQLIFAGGTCLSKAHRLIDRMSEDIDIKVLLTPNPDLKNDISSRARLRALHDSIGRLMTTAGFGVPELMNDRANPHVRDTHRYFVIGAQYATKAPALGTLRPELKLEVIHRHPKLPVEQCHFSYLYEDLANLPRTKPVSIQCIQVAETLAEKVLSLLRRCHWKWSGLQNDEMDPALVRHVYDVYRIMQEQPTQLTTACSVFKELVQADAEEYKGRDQAFEATPRAALVSTLAQAKTSKELQSNYQEKLIPLIFEGAEVDYATAFTAFEAAAHELIAQL
jgi:predicted nucleotidyltransferase component of viral defense system